MPTIDQGTELLTRDAEPTRLITPTGERVTDSDLDPWVADVFADQLLALYDDMVVARRIDTEATALQRQGELVLWPPMMGQEAAQIGSARALRSDDFVFSSYRENAVAYVRGADLTGMLRVWRGCAFSGWNPYDIGMATPSVIIGTQTLHAVGYALGCKRDGADSAAIAYFGDGATSEGDTNEAMIFAASFQAPVVFFCQNNQYAISEPVALQAARPIADRAPGFGIPSMRVDGNDVLAVLAATRLALERARTGDGPTFIEAVTYRMGAHTTSDDPTRYRLDDERAEWARRDPIARLRSYLDGLGVLTAGAQAAVDEHADRVAAELRAGCQQIAEPSPLSIFDDVYTKPSPLVERERSQYRAYLTMFADGAA
jgi:pyruvate dehydrogenase E1 component alpha subunit